MLRAMDIASAYIKLANSLEYDSIDNLKLNKMLYFAQGHCLARLGRSLFDDDIEAWQHGPVVGEVYRAYKPCGSRPIEIAVSDFDQAKLSSEELELLADVYSRYGKFTGRALEAMTHEKGTPWSKCYLPGRNVVIELQDIKEYFSKEDLPTFQIDWSKADIVDELPKEWDYDEDSDYA